MPLSVDEFSEDFAEMAIATAVDYFSGYYEIGVHPAPGDNTAILTDVGLMRMTRVMKDMVQFGFMLPTIISKVH